MKAKNQTEAEYIEGLERGDEEQPVTTPAPVEPQETRIASPVVEATEGAVFHDFDMRPPLLKLGQNTSSDIEPGMFWRADTEEQVAELYLVPLRIQAVRTKWATGQFSRDRRPECASDNGLTAVLSFDEGEREPLFPGQSCVSCPFYIKAPWLAGDQEYCEPGYKILLFDPETFEVLGMRLTGTNTQIARVLGAKKHLRGAVMKMWAEKVTSDKGSWYKIKVSANRLLDDGEKEIAEGQFQSYGLDIEE